LVLTKVEQDFTEKNAGLKNNENKKHSKLMSVLVNYRLQRNKKGGKGNLKTRELKEFRDKENRI